VRKDFPRKQQTAKKRSFLKKRTKKLLYIGTRLLQRRGLIFKSFLLLFFKKEGLAFLLALGISETVLDRRVMMGLASLTHPT